jgi:hypothetical protein
VTGDEFSTVDVDLLADYVGGALDGTPEHATVAELVARVPAWRTAHDALATGMAAVAGELRALGSAPEPMPADLTVRLDEALAAAAPRLESVPGLPSRPPRRHDTTRAAATAASRRRRMRWAVPIAAAAGVMAFAAVGIEYLAGNSNTGTDRAASTAGSAGRGEDAPRAASALPPLAAPPTGDQIHSSGTDYDLATLGNATAGTLAAPTRKGAAPAPGVAGDSAEAPLARLRAPDALLGCLDAIATANGAGAITVQSVDYARFRGAPAVVVRFSAANGNWGWASGPRCGAPGGDAATLASVPVG